MKEIYFNWQHAVVYAMLAFAGGIAGYAISEYTMDPPETEWESVPSDEPLLCILNSGFGALIWVYPASCIMALCKPHRRKLVRWTVAAASVPAGMLLARTLYFVFYLSVQFS